MGKRENEIECREKGKGRDPDLKSERRVRGIGGSANAKTLDGPISAVPMLTYSVSDGILLFKRLRF